MRFKNARGFTLIEVLVAFMILAISLVVVMQLFSGSLKAGAVSADYFYGIFHAQEKMEEILVQNEIFSGPRSGEFDDGYQWEAKIEEIPLELEDGTEMPVVGYKILLTVKWQKGGRQRQFGLETVRLGKRPDDIAGATK